MKPLRTAFKAGDRRVWIWGIAGCTVSLFTFFFCLNLYLVGKYETLESPSIVDRNGALLALQANEKQTYGQYTSVLPQRIKDLLVRKEDRFFYVHPGINPFSMLRTAGRYLIGQRRGGASTITQQLAKTLLGHEQDRSVTNKILETFGAFSLESFHSKDEILLMYANSVYMGNQVQGLHTASRLYFNRRLEDLDDTKTSMLLATLSSPSVQNPWRDENARASRNLANRLGVEFDPKLAIVTQAHPYAPPKNFELDSMHVSCARRCQTTLDADLTDHLREILETHVLKGWDAGARSGAIVVVKLPENEILAMVGTPDVYGATEGQQINMTLQPRPIGSTAKPFIYLQGFVKGLRPYTLVDDREYKFPIGSGFSLYPKNYDGAYRGWITLHSALSNSLNIPTVKVLQFVGLTNFYGFLENKLHFVPLHDLDDYQYGIALGALDMDPLTLANFLTIFPQKGILQPLRLFTEGTTTPYVKTPMSEIAATENVADPAAVALVTKVLNDRLTGVQQFGLASSLNLSQPNYAVKTGTSQDYHDSWTVGYTPDFLVVVWFGNPDNTPLQHVTGQSGAGGVWHDTMEYLMNTDYNRRTSLDLTEVKDILIDGSVDFGLAGDIVAEHRNLLPDNDLIASPLSGDTFMFSDSIAIPLVSQSDASWYVDGVFLGDGKRVSFSPKTIGDHTIKAVEQNGETQTVTIHVIVRR